MRQDSLYLSSLEMNWTSNFSRSESWTCDRSALATRSCGYSGEASNARSCSLSKSDSGSVAMLCCWVIVLTLRSTGGSTRVWYVNLRVQWAACLRWSPYNPGLQQAGWAHNQQRVVIPSGRHSAVAIDLRRVVQPAGRLIQEKVRKEGPVSGSAKYDTARWGWDVLSTSCEDLAPEGATRRPLSFSEVSGW